MKQGNNSGNNGYHLLRELLLGIYVMKQPRLYAVFESNEKWFCYFWITDFKPFYCYTIQGST